MKDEIIGSLSALCVIVLAIYISSLMA